MNLNKFLSNFGMLFQNAALFDSLSVWKNVAFDYTHIFEEHHNYFTEKSLSNLLEYFGYKILKKVFF